MMQDQEQCLYTSYRPVSGTQLDHSRHNVIIQPQKVEYPRLRNESSPGKIFFYAAIILGIQILQAKLLSGQQNDSRSHLDKFVYEFVFAAFAVRAALSISAFLTSGFYYHKDYFSTFRTITIILLVGAVSLSITTLFYIHTWLSEYSGMDYVYLWYLALLSVIEIVAMIPLAVILITSN